MTQRSNLFDLSGKAALVTGGTLGIGRAIADALLRHGAAVTIGSRQRSNVDQAVERLRSDTAGDVHGVVLDVTDDASVLTCVASALDRMGGLDLLVNAAGIHLVKPTFDVTPQEFNLVYDVHVTGSLRAAQAAGRVFRERGAGCIINVASMSSYIDLMEIAAYASAKNAVLGLTRALANEWAQFGIRTNAIAPGFFPNETTLHLVDGTPRGRHILEHTPMGRYGNESDIGGTAVYLASSAGRFVNGATIVVDGGFLTSGIHAGL